MKVLVVTSFKVPHSGGLSSHVEDLLSCLVDDGHEVELLEGNSVKNSRLHKLFNFAVSCGIRDLYLRRCLQATLFKLMRGTEKLIEKDSFDIIHCHDPIAGHAVQVVLSGMRRHIPVVETVHGPLTYETKMMLGQEINQSQYLQRLFQIEQKAFVSSAHLIAVDTGQANIAINDFGISDNKVDVIFNSVSCGKIDSITKNPPSIKIPKPYLLVPRRLVEKTGVRVAIEALAVINSDIEVNLVVVGDGPLKNELMQLTKDLELEDRVMFLGSIPRQEVLRFAKEAFAVVVPSIPSSGVVEATSIAVIEAMACGTVAIASNIGGLAELIQHNKTGFLVPHSDPVALGKAVSVLFEDQVMHDEICRQGRQYVLENLDAPIWCSKVKRVYEEVLLGNKL